MKKSRKIVLITVGIVAVLLVALLAEGDIATWLFADKLEGKLFPMKDPVSVINTEYQRSIACVDWIFDTDDKNKVVGFHDYVFVGEVKKVVGTGYSDVYFSDGLRMFSQPNTQYEIRVLKNLKGKLVTDRDIPLTKHDGAYPFGKKVSMLEGDNLPDVGECYIFICSADEKGELNIGSFSSFCDIYLCKAEDYTGEESAIEIYLEAIENMDESVRVGERYKSKYEAQVSPVRCPVGEN